MQLTASMFEQISASLRSDASASRDQRHQPRVGLRARTKILPLVVDDKGAAPIDVWVRDLSANGIGLTSTRAFPRDSQFLLRLAHPDGTRVEVKYRVVYTNATNGGAHVIGAVRQDVADAAGRADAAERAGPAADKPAGGRPARVPARASA